MQLTATTPVTAGVPLQAHANPLPLLVLTCAVMAALIGLYFDTASTIVALWNSSETFAHGYVILPISLWLIWRRRANFHAIPAQPCLPALALLALAGLGWLAGRMGAVQVVMQYAFAAMLPLAAWAMFGTRLARSLAFPLFFILFAVPFGEVFIGPLIEFTADFTVWALQLTGMPVLRNGTHFEIPSGNWSVVEACSGVRYLISSITLGCLYAYLTYHTAWRRAAFIALSVAVPIIANGLRAYMIVMIGHHSGMTLAVGVDHLIYGWLFFGLVMLLMFWIGGFWRQDAPATETAPALQPGARAGTPYLAGVALLTVGVAALWPAWAAYADRANHNPQAPHLALQLPAPAASPFTAWQPRYMPADASLSQTYQADAPVSVHIEFYRNQHNTKALISSSNRLATERDPFHVTATAVRQEPDGAFRVREARLSGPDGDVLVWYWLRVGPHATTNDYVGKAWQAWQKFSGQGDDGAAVLLATPVRGDAAASRATLRAFLASHRPAIDAALDRAQRK
jgi:exosortase A